MDEVRGSGILRHQPLHDGFVAAEGQRQEVADGDPAVPYADGTPFAGVVVTPPLTVPEAGQRVVVGDGTVIDLLALVPLHPAEVALKVARGTDALIDALDRGGVHEVLDPARPSFA
jgi:hypothetical protein